MNSNEWVSTNIWHELGELIRALHYLMISILMEIIKYLMIVISVSTRMSCC
jgi:hypothetical protein